MLQSTWALVEGAPELDPMTLPNLLDHYDQVVELLRGGRLGLLVDFDGTVADIVPMPGQAAVSPRAAESLRRLARSLELVCVISGRGSRDLRDKVGLDDVVYVGNHGAEYLDAGRLHVPPGAARYRDAIKRVFDHLRAAVVVTGLQWDDKYYTASVHYRLAGDPSDARRLLEAALETAPLVDQLEVFWGKMVLEIRPTGGFHKGYAVRKLVRERRLNGAIVMGDDTTDLDALIALGELRAQDGLQGVGVAILHQDTPEELVRAADYGLLGVREVEVFLEWLAEAAG
jgi:trehalose 6-phosphate phosphatase